MRLSPLVQDPTPVNNSVRSFAITEVDPSEYEPQVVELPPSPPPPHSVEEQLEDGGDREDRGERGEEKGEVEDKGQGDGGKEKRENGGVSSVCSGGILAVHVARVSLPTVRSP